MNLFGQRFFEKERNAELLNKSVSIISRTFVFIETSDMKALTHELNKFILRFIKLRRRLCSQHCKGQNNGFVLLFHTIHDVEWNV